MVRAARTDERQAALRFCLVAFGWLICLFAWASILSFDVADAPSASVWPHPSPPHNLCGAVGARLAHTVFWYFGLGVYPLLLLVHAAVVAWSKGARLNDLWLRAIGLGLITTTCAAFATILIESSDKYLMSGPGGTLGAATATFLLSQTQMLGTTLLLALSLVVGLVLAADNLLVRLFRTLRWAGRRSRPVIIRSGNVIAGTGVVVANGVASLSDRLSRASNAEEGAEPAEPVEPRARQFALRPPTDEEIEEDNQVDHEPADSPAAEAEATEPKSLPEADIAAREPARPFEPEVREIGPQRPPPRSATLPFPRSPDDDDYELPEVDLLDRAIAIDKAAIEALCREKAYILEQTLNEFRLAVEVVRIDTGPVITMFELKLAPGIKVSQIQSLSNDMARALKAPAVRVVAPLPGKNTIGIEVPNIDKEKVRLRDLMELSASQTDKLGVPLFLGKDAGGHPLLADLTRMPHLLIAGTTGSGKSVCIGSIITSILMTRTPAEINLILVDPKVVELAMYKDVPHLMCPIVTEVPRAEAILEWASTKMDERYALLAEAGVKDIRSYNRLGEDGLRERLSIDDDEELERIPAHLPYIVIIIDELADLMMTSAKEVEFYLCRIAQKSRAVGIHLIVSTQRPQANVVTGLIKSNMPCRIAFRVASRLDSRIVLDQNGGEVLMGQGDMLFLPPGQSKLVRAQGTFVDDGELRSVVKHCKEQRDAEFHPELVRIPGADAASTGQRDELFDQAVDIIVQTGRGSVSLLQRRLTVGYSRASRLVDQMYEAGIVGEYKGSQAREVMVTQEEWDAMKAQRNAEEAAETAEFQME